MKIVTIVGTRPELVRLSVLIPALDSLFEHVIIHTGQNFDYELNEIFFSELGIRKPDHYLGIDNSAPGKAIAQVVEKSFEALAVEKPDAVIILGDTNSAVSAFAAERLGIPVYHLEAGNRSFDRNVPEELNRRMVDHVSSFNLPYTPYARENLLREGLNPRFICLTGSPIVEVFSRFKDQIGASQILKELDLTRGGFLLASLHRQENVDDPARLQAAVEALSVAGSRLNLPVLMSTHPRTRAQLKKHGISGSDNLTFHSPLGYFDYCKLQMNALVTISDSGSIAEEAAIMNFPAVTMRDSMERPEALECGAVTMSGLNPENLLESIEFALARPNDSKLPLGYEVDNFSQRVIGFLISTVRRAGEWQGIRK
ncbi:MAG: hypothetical protein RI929_290 [Actinomycetota bacterium]